MQGTSGWARFRRSEAASGLSMIAPPGIYVILLLAVPLFTVLLTSFYTDGVTETGSKAVLPILTFENYHEVWTKPIYRVLMLRSLFVSMSVTLITVLLAYPIAYFVSFHVAPSKKSLWLFLITIPFWTSYIIRVFLWKVVLGYNGVFSSGLEMLGITGEPMSFLTNGTVAVTVTLAHAYAPFAILPIFVALEKIDRSFLEAGQDLGESKFATFLRVTLPLSMPGVIASVMIVFIPTVGDYITPAMVGGPDGMMAGNLIQSLFGGMNNWPAGAALSVVLIVAIAAAGLAFTALSRLIQR